MHLLTNESACSISVILQNAVAQLSPLKYQILFGLMRNYHCPSLTTKQENKSVVDKNTGLFCGTDFPSSWGAKVKLGTRKRMYTMLKAWTQSLGKRKNTKPDKFYTWLKFPSLTHQSTGITFVWLDKAQKKALA